MVRSDFSAGIISRISRGRGKMTSRLSSGLRVGCPIRWCGPCAPLPINNSLSIITLWAGNEPVLQRLNKILGLVDCPPGEYLTSVKLKKGLVELILKSNNCLVKSNDCLVLSNDNAFITAVDVGCQ